MCRMWVDVDEVNISHLFSFNPMGDVILIKGSHFKGKMLLCKPRRKYCNHETGCKYIINIGGEENEFV